MLVLKYKRLKLKLRVFLAVIVLLLCHENNANVFTSDWAVFRYHDCSIKRAIIMTHQNLSLVMCWKLF